MSQLDRIELMLSALVLATAKGIHTMSAQLTALQAQVAQNTSVESSAVTLIQGLASQLATAIAAANNGDTAALPALQSELSQSAAALAAAITANTPAAPTSPTAPAATP